MEWRKLWHVPPQPPVTPIEQDPAYWIVANWLAEVLGVRLLWRPEVHPVGPGSYSSNKSLALPSVMWAKFRAFMAKGRDKRLGVQDEQHFALLVANWLGEWPRRHDGCSEARWVGLWWLSEAELTHRRKGQWPCRPPLRDPVDTALAKLNHTLQTLQEAPVPLAMRTSAARRQQQFLQKEFRTQRG